MDPDDVLEPALSDDQRRLLWFGLGEFRGPAHPTEQLAVAMGFRDLDDLNSEGWRIQQAIEGRLPVRRLDWLRALIATEFCFSSDLLGAGHDWMFTTGLSDEVTIHLLRQVQLVLGPEVRSLIGRDLGTLPDWATGRLPSDPAFRGGCKPVDCAAAQRPHSQLPGG